MEKETFGRNAGQTAFFERSAQFRYFLLVEEELPVPEVVDVENVPFLVGSDVHVGNVGFPVAHENVGVADRSVAATQRLDFRPGQDEPGRQEVREEVFVMGPPVLEKQAAVLFLCHEYAIIAIMPARW